MNLKNPLKDIQNKLNQDRKTAQLAEYDEKLEGLADRIERMIQKHGEEYFMVDILKSFLDISINLREIMEIMEELGAVTECFNFAIGFIDDAMLCNDRMLESTMDTKYTFMSGIKAKIRAGQIRKNNARRMNAVVRNISSNYGMAMDMVENFKKLSTKLKKNTAKIAVKNKKKEKRDKKYTAGGASQPTAADLYLANRRASKSGTSTANTTGGTYTPPAPDKGGDDLTGNT